MCRCLCTASTNGLTEHCKALGVCICAVPLCRWFGKRSSKLNHMKWKQVEQTIKTEARINIQWCIINENFSVNGELLPISKSDQEKYRTANWKRNIERASWEWMKEWMIEWVRRRRRRRRHKHTKLKANTHGNGYGKSESTQETLTKWKSKAQPSTAQHRKGIWDGLESNAMGMGWKVKGNELIFGWLGKTCRPTHKKWHW